jgi:hypothetical protein
MKGSHLFWLSRSKGMTVDIWIRDDNPPRCFQKKISDRGKHNVNSDNERLLTFYMNVLHSQSGIVCDTGAVFHGIVCDTGVAVAHYS